MILEELKAEFAEKEEDEKNCNWKFSVWVRFLWWQDCRLKIRATVSCLQRWCCWCSTQLLFHQHSIFNSYWSVDFLYSLHQVPALLNCVELCRQWQSLNFRCTDWLKLEKILWKHRWASCSLFSVFLWKVVNASESPWTSWWPSLIRALNSCPSWER